MNPAFIDAMSWEMAEVYGAITDQILINLARHFPFYNAGDPLPSSAFEYQAAMLAQMGQVNRETISIIRRGLSDADDALQMVLEQSIIDSVRKAEPELLKAAQAGILKPAGVPIVAPGQMRAFQLYYGQAADKFNLVNTVMLESTQSAYRQAVTDVASYVQVRKQIEATQTALDIAAGETVTGVSTWNQALRHATDRLNDRGITGFVDHAGRQWSAEAYVAMDIRTTAFNTARAAVWETNQNFGNDLYSVSYHQGARPLCYDWQNKVISANNRSGVTYDLDGNEIRVYAQSETTYGEPAGLFGINCKHYPTPFIPGVSVIEGKPQDPEDNEKTYKESQEQRRLERKLREEKRDYLTAKAQGRPQEELDLLREKCRATSGDIDQFCKETGRARHRDREGVYTKRDFPDKEKYNVADFERKQQEELRQYFSGGGAQTGYNFGEMTPKHPQQENKEGKTEGERRKEIIADYDRRIKALEQERLDLISSGSDDYEKSDKLFADAERLQRKRDIVQNGGYTLEQATVTHDRFIISPGSSSETIIEKANIYEMPDGVRFVFKANMNHAHQTLTPDELIDAYYSSPKALRDKAQKTFAVVDRYNPADAYWRKTYKNFTHSYMTGGEQIAIWRHDGEHYMNVLTDAIRHEEGHGLDRLLSADSGTWFSGTKEWADAMEMDKAFSGGVADSVSSYGRNSVREDFAESVMKFTGSPGAFKAAFPNRASIIERLIYGGENP